MKSTHLETFMGKRLQGKIALVTGASTGIGLATAKAFADEGAKVFVTGRRGAKIEAAVAAIGPNAVGIEADSTKLADLDRVYSRIKTEAGRLDVLFANAGGGSMLPLGAITEEQYDDTFNRNVKAVLFTVQKGLPLLTEGASSFSPARRPALRAPPTSVCTARARPRCATSHAVGFSISRAAASA
jgi:NAD(P)-dependent dehydrogenase (short-subunit alcohol dehydrogenase family)